MTSIALGIDVSKGRADIAIRNQSGTQLAGSGGYDDTQQGQERLRTVLGELHRRHPQARLIAGVEATGGYERNWVAFFQRERAAGLPVVVHRLNPLAVKRYLGAELHRKVSDDHAAQGIARLLLERYASGEPAVIALDGRVSLYRQIRGLIVQRSAQQQILQNLLGSTNPELIPYCRHGLPAWLLAVCERYPTAVHLARGQLQTLAAIPHVKKDRAAEIHAAAKTSTASLTDAGAAAAVQLCVAEIRALDQRIGMGQATLAALMQGDPRVALLEAIPGIGTWSANALVLEIGDPTRFTDVRQLIAYAGLDPRVEESGDGVKNLGISHRGNRFLRAILFPLAQAALQHHPCVGDFIRRKLEEGKPWKVAVVAGSAKILRIAYAILVSGKPYDPEHEAHRARPAAQQRQDQRSAAATPPAAATTPEPDLKAPISAKEARKRRQARAAKAQANAPAPRADQNEVGPQTATGADAHPGSLVMA